MINVVNSEIAIEYKKITKAMLKLSFPSLSDMQIEEAINYSIMKNYTKADASIYNNYKEQTVDSTVLDITNYILSRKPIMTSRGVLFSRHGTVPNPIYNMVQNFIDDRKIKKKEMFKYPKGSELFEKFNLLQLLAKIDANGFYGTLGAPTCIYFNLHVAASITTQGRSAISAAALLFESFFNNNVPFSGLNELITFIYNVDKEKRNYDDKAFIDENISIEECFNKLIMSCGFGFIPTKKQMIIVWDILSRMTQETINRLFYKNNLFSFMDNNFMKKFIISMIKKLNIPYLDPNKEPKEIKEDLEYFWSVLKEFVYYDKQLIDRLGKMDSMIRSISIIQDTDSAIISLDGWYRYVLELVKDEDVKIKTELISPCDHFEKDEYGDMELVDAIEIIEPNTEYDFMSDELIELERTINPIQILPQDGLRYSIINIMCFCVSKMSNDFMEKYTMNINSYQEGKPCLLVLKNEFLFKRALIKEDAKKNYATYQELQEGNKIPSTKALDVKGMEALTKSSMNITTRTKLKKIMLEDILNSNCIDQIKILKDIAKIEKEVYNSIIKGEKIYYKPVKIKSISTYDDPMRIQGIKAAVVYNAIKDKELEAINLEERNSIIIIKVDINENNAYKIKDSNPETFDKIMNLIKNDKNFAAGISAVAIPINVDVPKWILPFVEYKTIISDNIKGFPLESIGISRGNSTYNNYTNIVKI